MTNYSHLSYDERVSIEDALNNNESISQIAKDLKRSHSTILREVDRNKVYSKSNYGITNKYIYLDYSFECEKLNKRNLTFVMVALLVEDAENTDTLITLEKLKNLMKS